MKRILFAILLFVATNSMSQTSSTMPTGAVPYGSVYIQPDGSVWSGATGKGFKKIGLAADILRLNDSITALRSGITAVGATSITAGPITSLPVLAFNPGSNITPGAWITASFYASQPPTASLSGGFNQELHSAGTYTGSVSWSGGRQSATATLATINVDGVNQTFSQPTQGASASGTKSVSMAYNANTTYTNTVTTSDGKTASATTSFAWYPKRYWGRASSTPNNAAILASTGGGNELAGSRNGTFTITASGSNYLFYAYPSNQGDLTSINIGGLESLSAFTKTTLTLTNASGYAQTYNVYTSNNATSGNATIVTQ